jgi:hypothetical protein
MCMIEALYGKAVEKLWGVVEAGRGNTSSKLNA